MSVESFLQNIINLYGENLLWYSGFAVPSFLIFWIIGKNYFKKIRIQEIVRANMHHFKHDLGFSSITFLIFALMDAGLLFLESKGYTKLYFDITDYGFWWLGISFFIVLFIDDMFFYWSHRAMHLPRFYKFFHKVHHESTDPSPLTAFAFHPSEAIIENLMHFVLPFIIPLNFGIVLLWQIFSMLNNVVGHLGYEIYPKGWVKIPLLKFKTVSTHHNMHHQLFNGNYALYFTWWDRWMKTEFTDYEIRHNNIFERDKIHKSVKGFYPLVISAIRKENNNAFTLEFCNVPYIFKDFSAGQHITIKVSIEGEIFYRTFSISSVPNSGNNLTLTIKRIKGGKVTNFLYTNIKIGDTLEVTAPSGQFHIIPDPANQNHYVMIAGGSGITPIYSMIGTILKLEPKSHITLLYANRSMDTIIFKDKITKWQNEFSQQLNVKYFLSEEQSQTNEIKGYITRISLEEIINQFDTKNMYFFLCGPEMMTTKLREDLIYLGVSKEKINRELFLIAKDKNESNYLNAKITANLFGNEFSFETKDNKTILQSGLTQNIPLPYSCQSGLCGMCKMKCIEGKVMMLNNQVLTKEEIKEGFILTCQSIPQTQSIKIKNP
ncbi:MAG: sterol desaturase family protein [Sediminibacterium sp.]